MLNGKKSFLIYLDYEQHFAQMTHEQVGELIMGLLAYSKTSAVPRFNDGIVSMAFSFIKSQIDRDDDAYRRKCEINQENGKQGGRPKKKAEGFPEIEKTERFSEKPRKTERLISKPKKPDTDKDKDIDTDKDTGIDTETDTDKETDFYSETANAVSHEPADASPCEKTAVLSGGKETKTTYKQIQDMFNRLCPSLPEMKTLSEARKKLIKSCLKTYTLEQVEEVFRKAEASSFLRGDKGMRGERFTANFDWLMKDANFAKTLDGNYDDKGARETPPHEPDELDKIFGI